MEIERTRADRERRYGAWKITLRTNIIEWGCVPPSMPVPFADVAEIAFSGLTSRSKDDPSYRRPLFNLRASSNPAAESAA